VESICVASTNTNGFKRSLKIDEKINTETIDAKYVNGILTLNLPKKQEVKPTPKQINIL